MMAEVLSDRFGLSDKEAGKRVEALERAHSIRWIETRSGPPSPPHVSPAFAEAIGTETQMGPGSPAEANLLAEEGYWQLL